ncbi:hypothetical protein D3C75_925910 [compost metagenome]
MAEQEALLKQKGKCPFCEETVAATVIEDNTVRRDKCQCPNCNEFIFLCRSPGCHDYAKGTQVYDHELCPSCTDTVSEGFKVIGKSVLTLATTVIGGLILAAAKKK